MEIIPAQTEDAPLILALQKLAFQSEGQLYDNFTIPPLTQTLPELQAEMQSHVFLKLVQQGQILGSVRGKMEKNTCHIARLMVHPEYQGQGWGGALMAAMEQAFAQAQRYEVFTGHKSQANLDFYARLGYVVFSTEMLCPGINLVFLEKSSQSLDPDLVEGLDF